MAKLGISIVNFNSGEYLKKCLGSLLKVKDEVTMEIWVVDNNSSDDSLDKAKNILKKFPKYQIIENDENLGFGKAHNQVLKHLKSEYILILNPDTEVKDGVIKKMISYIEKDSNIGAATPQIILSTGKVDLTAHRGFPTPMAAFKYYFLKDESLYHLTNRDMEKPHEVDAISGAFFLTRRSILDKVGYFDEDYFMYAEDLDLCYRIKQAGYKVMYVPSVKILHHKGISTGLKKHSQHLTTATLETRKKMTSYFYDTMRIFYKKHLARKYPLFINWLVYLGIDVKTWLAKRKMTV